MESFARPLRKLAEELGWFVRAKELKVLHVVTEAPLRRPLLDLVVAHEFHADNRALFLRFDDSASGPDRGWGARAARLREQLAEKQTMLRPAGIALRPLPDDGALRREGAGAAFATTLLNARGVLAPPLTELVAVLAPARVEAPLEFAEDVAALVASPHLAHVRFVLVETDGVFLSRIVERCGAKAIAVTCQVDQDAGKRDLAAAGAATAAALPAFSLPAIAAAQPRPHWRVPGAGPDVVPPPRPKDDRVPPTDQQLRAAGISPLLAQGGGEALKQLVLGAALAMRETRTADAIQLQSRAAELCGEMEMPREQAINLFVLGGYFMAAGARDRARQTYVRIGELARSHRLLESEAQAELALGMLESVERRAPQAAAHYAAAGKLAEAANAIPLAMECWRVAGQLGIDSGLESSGVECWKRAISLAGGLEPELRPLTSAAETARALAALCRKRGLIPQAVALERQSVELEQQPPPPTAPEPESASAAPTERARERARVSGDV